jgi:hypothetical protein
MNIRLWYRIAPIILMIVLGAVGCDGDDQPTAEDAKKEVKETAVTAGEWMTEKAKQAVQALEEDMSELSGRYGEVRDNADQLPADAKAEWDKTKLTIDQKLDEARKEQIDLQRASEKNWDEAKSEADEALREAREEIAQAADWVSERVDPNK